jgi:type I restriction enzyme S subunit
MGRCALVSANEVGWICGTGSLNVRLLPEAFPPFISIYLRTEYVREWLKLESVGSTMDNLNTQILGAIKLPLPNLAEQTAIVEFLATELLKSDTLTAEAQRAIDLLQERRTALISAAVTGQIDVRQHPKN